MDRKALPVGAFASALVAGITLTCPAVAWAAETATSSPVDQGGPAAPESASELQLAGEIVVTARRREERLQDVPVAITAFNAAKLEQFGIQQTSDLRQVTPSLNVQGASGREDNPTYLLRGQRANDTVLTQDAAVASYVDDVLIGAVQGSNLGLFDLESVQVLKGPQGTLFGRNSTGGAILFRTAQPTDEFSGKLSATIGGYAPRGHHYGAQGSINIPASDTLKFRAAFNVVDRNGWGKIVEGPRTGDRLHGRKEVSGRLTAAFEPSDTVKSTTTAYGSKADLNGVMFQLREVLPTSSIGFVPGALAAFQRQKDRGWYENGANFRTDTRIRVWGIYNTTALELGDDITFKNIIGYRDLKYRAHDDFDGTPVQIGPSSGNTENAEQFSEEAQVLGNAFDNNVNFVLGVYYFNMHGIENTFESHALEPINPGSPSALGGPYRNEAFAGYGQATAKTPIENLSVTAGLRYTVDRRSVTLSPQSLPAAPGGAKCSLTQPGVVYTLANCTRSESTSFAKPTWTLTLDYKADPSTLLYLAHRRGYRSGGYNTRAASNAQFAPFKPEIVDDVEIGVKKEFRFDTWSLQTNLAAYHQWYRDIQRNVNVFTDGSLQSSTINAAKAKISGGELEVNANFGRIFSGGIGYSYVKADYTDFPSLDTVNGVPGQPVNFKDVEFASVPRHQFNVNARIGLPFDESIGTVDFSATYFYQSKIYLPEIFQTAAQLRNRVAPAQKSLISDNLAGLTNKGYGLLNLRLDWKDIMQSPVSVALIARNALNKKYYTSGISILDSLGMAAGVVGEPRLLMMEASFKF